MWISQEVLALLLGAAYISIALAVTSPGRRTAVYRSFPAHDSQDVDDPAMATLKVPLADPKGSPKQGSRQLLLQHSGTADLQELSRVCAWSRTWAVTVRRPCTWII